ncbi:MAG: hypothetical protein WC450_07370 [Candidatus Omnitrophota bacterium]|jgi:hypothetical protein
MNPNGITTADVPDVFNLPPYGCARRLYFQKIGEPSIDPCSVDDEQSRKAKLRVYDPFIFNVYTKTTKRVTRVPNPQIFINLRYPFIFGDTDRLQTNKRPGHGKYVPLEIRVLDRVSFYEIRKNGLPDRYYNFMLHHLMIAKNAQWASVAFFCPDIMEMKVFDITYDESTAADVINVERSFWYGAIQEKVPPPISTPFAESCELCGYCHKCYNDDYVKARGEKETLELIETVNKINNYLKEK